jgi:hypothetical protein
LVNSSDTETVTPEKNKVQKVLPRYRRPFFIWVLFAGLLLFSIINGLRLYGAVYSWTYWKLIGLSPDPLYFAITGGIFAAAFLIAVVLLFFQLRGALWTVRGVIAGYVLWYWIDRLVFTRSGSEITNWPFAAGITVLFAGFALAALQAAQVSEQK